MYGNKDKMVTFGGGFDLCISSDSHLENNSHSNLGYSYQLPNNILKGSDDARKYLAGSFYFKIV